MMNTIHNNITRRAPSAKQSAARADFAAAARIASRLYRDYIAKDPAARCAGTWQEAMREAWQEVRAEALISAALRSPEIYDTLRKLAARMPSAAAREQRRYLGKLGEIANAADAERLPSTYGFAAWMVPVSRGGMGLCPWEDALSEIAAEAWTSLAEGRIRAEGRTPRLMMLAACKAACKRLYLKYHPAATKRGSRYSGSLDDAEFNPEASLAARFPAPEAEVIRREAIYSLAQTPEERIILRGLEAGAEQAQIAEAVRRETGRESYSQQAVSKAIARLRRRREAQIARERAGEE